MRYQTLLALVLVLAGMARAQEAVPTPEMAVKEHVDLLWTCLAAFLVFFMQAGFALVETGFTRAKNAVNIIMKNLMDFAMGSLAYWFVGFGLMFGVSNKIFGSTGFMLSGVNPDGTLNAHDMAFWMFQVVFAATAATIVSGAMAERTKFTAYLIYSVFISLLIYPLFGKWAWGSLWLGDAGQGWLEAKGFVDFAGSTVVHSVGGWAALAGALVLGPRIGKYDREGKPRAIPGHNIPLAALGVFILWFGWFGFNPGSTTSIDGGAFARVAVTTNLAAAAGAVSSMLMAWFKFGKPDASMTLNGALAGLVAITAPCYNVSPLSAVLIGLVAGGLVVFAVVFIEQASLFGRRIDDPVGAISVHGVCGVWGTLSVGLFAQDVYGGGGSGLLFGGGVSMLLVQLLGVVTCFVWTFGTALVLFVVLHKTVGLRVSEVEELEGLDLGEHGMEAYPEPLGLGASTRDAELLAVAARSSSAAPRLAPASEAGE